MTSKVVRLHPEGSAAPTALPEAILAPEPALYNYSVLAILKEELREPAVIAEYVRTYHEERRRLAHTARFAHFGAP